MNDTINHIRNRPRFKLYTELSPKEYEEKLKAYLELHKDRYYGNVNQEVATIWIKNNHNNYWKPNLALRIEKEEELTAIRGIFGPSSAVWTFFMFLYFFFTVMWMTFFTLHYVEKQISTNNYPWALPCSFAVLGLIALTYVAVRIGQYKAKDEMAELRKLAEEITLQYEKN